MSPFPSSQERIVASAVLLPCSSPPSPSLSPPRLGSDLNELKEERSTSRSCRESFVSSDYKSSCLSHTNDDGSSEEIRARRIRFFSAIAHCHEMTFKLLGRVHRRFYGMPLLPANKECPLEWRQRSLQVPPPPWLPVCQTARVESPALEVCAILTAEKMLRMVRERDTKHQNPKHVIGSSHIRRQADAILKVLSDGGSSEVRIRQLLGDCPDTSKALRVRMLLKQTAVKRSGSGGRKTPLFTR